MKAYLLHADSGADAGVLEFRDGEVRYDRIDEPHRERLQSVVETIEPISVTSTGEQGWEVTLHPGEPRWFMVIVATLLQDEGYALARFEAGEDARDQLSVANP